MAAERVNTANKTAPSETFETWVHEVDQPSKNVKQAWDEQFAFISALGDAVDYDDPEMGGISVLGGKEAPELDNGKELKEVKQMADSGALQTALAHLSATHGNPSVLTITRARDADCCNRRSSRDTCSKGHCGCCTTSVHYESMRLYEVITLHSSACFCFHNN